MTNAELRKKINELPKGGVTIKKSNGRAYAYYQWTENGKQKGRRITNEEYRAQFVGKDINLEGVDTISGSTVSSKAYMKLVTAALQAQQILSGEGA